MKRYLQAIVPRKDKQSPFFGENPIGDGSASSVPVPISGHDCEKVNVEEETDEEWLQGATAVLEKVWEKIRVEAGGPTDLELQQEREVEEQHVKERMEERAEQRRILGVAGEQSEAGLGRQGITKT
jgi:hypothetical protein